MRKETIVTILVGLLLVVVLSACGGTKNVGTLDSTDLQESRDTMGVTLGDYEVVRGNAAGEFDTALNSTLDLRLEENGGVEALVIGVNDSTLVDSVVIEVRYDGAAVHADRAEFSGIFGAADVIEGTFLGSSSKAGIAQICVGNSPAQLSGDFATVYFADGASRTVSATNGVHPGNIGEILYEGDEALPNYVATSDTDAETAMVTWYGAWHKADGTQDSLVTVTDMTPIGVYYNQNVGDEWLAAIADYNPDRLITVGDITPIGQNYEKGTSGYRIEVSDDTGDEYSGITPTLIKDVSWGDAEHLTEKNHADAIIPGQLWPVFNMWQLEVTPTSEFTWEELSAADVDGNEYARVWITVHDGEEDGSHAFADIQVYKEPVIVADRIVIQDYQIQVVGTDNGGEEDTDIYSEELTAGSIVADTTGVSMVLYAIDGTFNAIEFDGSADPTTWPEGMTQADYDIAMAAATDALSWNLGHAGAIGFRRTADWLSYDPPAKWPVAGNPPGTAVIFPDFDPDSNEAAPEGTLSTELPVDGAYTYPADDDLEVHVYASISLDCTFDVTINELQAEISSYGMEGDPTTELLLNEATTVLIPFKWGENGAPVDVAATALELHEINTTNGLSRGVAEALVYTVEETPLPGEYNIFDIEDVRWLNVVVPGGNLDSSTSYAFRFQSDGLWSTINLPVELLTTAEPPPPQTLEVLPERCYDYVDELQIFYSDPVIRRNPNETYDLLLGSFVPDDEPAFLDILKTNGDEFILKMDSGLWPKVAIVETANPNAINELSDGLPGINSFEPSPGRLMADISLITTTGDPGDPVETYSFKWFNLDGTVVGQGTFEYSPWGNFSGTPIGVNWGVNLFNREEATIGARDYDGKNVVNGATVFIDAPSPDVLWFEFGDGNMFSTAQDSLGVYPSADDSPDNNVLVFVEDTISGDSYYMGLSVRVIGLGDSGNMLAIHSLNILDWQNSLYPGWAGQLETNGIYNLGLDDKATGGIEYFYPTQMIVTGPNPNSL